MTSSDFVIKDDYYIYQAFLGMKDNSLTGANFSNKDKYQIFQEI